MSLIQSSNLPAFERLMSEGIELIKKSAQTNEKKTNIALLNMMPDAVLEATERQFIRLLGKANTSKQIYFHPFALNYEQRSEKTQQHVEQYYTQFEELKKKGIDALIISGANVPLGEMSEAPFWQQLTGVFDWVVQNDIPTLFTCLASHCAIEYFYGKKRILLDSKCWGVFEHTVKHPHPLTQDLPDKIMVPQSRMNTISHQQMAESGLEILVDNEHIGGHMLVSKKQPYFLFFQGHPEYDSISLLKEYKREVMLFVQGIRTDYPAFPQNYFSEAEQAILTDYQRKIIGNQRDEEQEKFLALFPEKEITKSLNNSWHEAANIVIQNWLNSLGSHKVDESLA